LKAAVEKAGASGTEDLRGSRHEPKQGGAGPFFARLLGRKRAPTGRAGRPPAADGAVDTSLRDRVDESPRDPGEVYRSLVNHIGIGVFRTTPGIAGRFLEVNPAMEQITGYSREELLQVNVTDLYVHPDERAESVRRVLSGDLSGPIEALFKKKDGTVIVVRETKVAVNSDDGRAIYLEGFLEDITERKKAEEALLVSDAALRSLHEGVIAMDDKFIVTRWNEECERLFGVKAADAIGKYIGEHVSMIEDWPGQNKERLDLLVARGYNREEQHYRCPAGDIWVDVHAQAIETGGKRHGWVTLAADTTARKKAEEALRQSEEKLRMMFQGVAEGVVLSDMKGVITDVNQAMLAIFGLKSRDDMVGRRNIDFIAPEDWDKVRLARERTVEQGAVSNLALTGLKADGQRMSIEVSAGLLRGSAGNPLGLVITLRDVTETKRMQEQLLAQNRLASIGELVSGVAHEINNPLTGVIGFSELLQQQEIPEDIKEDLGIISREARRAALIIRDLLTFARKHPATKQPAKINSIVEDVLRLRAYEHSVNNIEVVRRFAPDLPEVTVDYYQMQQVFLNIIVNAEYFMAEAHKGGRLTITTEKVDGVMRVSFSDDGPGIAPANLARVFDPFFTTKDVGKGTGLGLSICHGIVSEHRGRLYAASLPGEGATFVVELPMDPPEAD